MTKYLSIFIISLISYIHVIAAPGDNCTNVIAISSNGCSAVNAYNNTGITGTLAAPSCFTGGNNNGMWFQFVATTKVITISVNGGTLTQPQIALLQTPTDCNGTFTELACNSSGTSTASLVYSNLIIGNVYFIYVDGRNNLTGSFQLCLASPIPPKNDNPCTPIVVPANNYCSDADAFTNVGATSENLLSTVLPSCWTTTGAQNTVYFQFTALHPNNSISVSGINSPQIAIISTANCNGTAWTNNGASNCASSTTTSVTMNANNLVPGQTYLIAVDGRNDNVGSFKLCVNSFIPVSVPTNDQCNGAIDLVSNVPYNDSTFAATATNDIPVSLWDCNGSLDHAVWYKFTAANPIQPVVFTIDATCTGNVLQIDVFDYIGTGNPCTPANNSQYSSIQCDNSANASTGTVTMTVPAADMIPSKTYYVLIDSWPSDYCNFTMTVTGTSTSGISVNAGPNQNKVCIAQAPFNNIGTPSGGTWSGTGITNAALGTFNPQVAGIGTHTLFYTFSGITDQKTIEVTGPQIVTSNDVSICAGSTQLVGSVNFFPPSGTAQQFTNTTDYTIPDNSTTGVSSVINVTGINPNSVAINPIQKVCLNINHTWDGDLDIFLRCPGGTQILLSDDNGGSSENYTNTCFVATGTAITSGSAPFTGNYTPEQPFTNLNSCNINGAWTLLVYDDASGDIGTILDWSIYFNQEVPVTYTWSPTTNMIGANTLNPIVSPTVPTTYYLSSTDQYGCTIRDSVRVNLGGSIAGPDQSICINKSTTFASSGTGTWTPLASNPATVTIQSNTNPTSNIGPFTTLGTYNFEWNAGGCKDTVRIVVNSLPTANAGPDKIISCTTPNITIGTAATSGITYTWTPTNGLSNPNIAQPTASQSGTFILTATNPITSCFTTDTVVITQSASLPVANAGIDKELTCTVNAVSIGSAPVSGINYTWTPTNGLSNPNIAQPNASQPGTFTVTATDPVSGCSATDIVIVTRNNTLPIANAGTNQVLTCAVTSVSIGTAAAAGTSYVWTPNNGLSNPNIAQPNASQPGTFTVTATNNANGCTATDAVTITQNTTAPVANAGIDKALTCSNTSIQIGTTAVAGVNYTWLPTTGLINPNTAQPTATQPNTYTVTATNPANGCSANDAVVVTQNNTLPVANAGIDKVLTCSVTSVTIGTTALANTTYSWFPTNGLSNPNTAQPSASQPGTFTVTATNTINGCTATDVVIVTQDITPPTANAGADNVLTCNITSVTIGTPALAGVNYTWTPTSGLSNPNIAQPSTNQSGTFTVKATSATNGCSSTDAVTITKNITPPTANAGPDKAISCSLPSTQIGTPALANTTYSWSPTIGLINPNIAQPTATQSGTFIVTATNTINGCTSTDAVTITQTSIPPTANAGIDKTLTCTTTAVSIGTAPVAGINYSWFPTIGLINPNTAQPTATQSGTYTVTATNPSNGCSSTDAVTITQDIVAPVANAGINKVLTCASPTAIIGTTALSNVNYTWTPTIGLTSSTIAQPTVNQAGTYTVTATSTTNGCFATDAVIITQSASLPTANAGIDKVLTCSVTSVSIGSPSVSGINYSWLPTNGLSNPNSSQTNASQPGTFIVTATDPISGCSASDAVTITQDILAPIANAGIDKTLTCTTTSVTIGSTAVAGINYTWSPPNGLSNANAAQTTTNQPGTFVIKATNPANGCFATDAVIISQDITSPTINAGTDKVLTCTTTSVIIGTSAAVGTNYNYSWFPTNGLSNPNLAQSSASQTGTFTLTATDPNNGCTSSDIVNITKNTTLPIANAGIDKVLTCSNASLPIGTAAVAGINYSWMPTNGLVNPNTAQPNTIQPGTYTVTATDPTNGCFATDVVVITQNTTPPIANAGIDKTLNCNITSVTIGSTSVVAGINYTWAPSIGLSNPNNAQTNTTKPNTYTLTATNPINGCSSTDVVTVFQDTTRPTANAGIDKKLTCSATSVNIGSIAVSGINYTWAPAIGLSNPNIAQPNTTKPNTYILTATNPINGCSTSDAVIISQDTTSPIADAGIDKKLTCTTTSVVIGTAAIGGVNYTWTPANNFTNSNIAQPSTSQAGTYTVTATNPLNGCSKSNSVLVTIDTLKPIANAGSDRILTCKDTIVSIGSNAIVGTNYSWFPSIGLTFNNGISKPDASKPGTYTVTAVNSNNGCIRTDEVIITQDITPPVADAGIDGNLTCTTNFITIGSPAVPGIKYVWSPANGLNVTNLAQPNASDSGTYAVVATNPINGCFATDTVIITANRPYSIIDAGNDVTIYQEESAPLEVIGVNNGNIIWTPANTLSCSSCFNPIASPLVTTQYHLTYTNTDGCVSKDSVNVNVIPIIGLYFPEAFSPNGDGVNDAFTALGDSVKSYELYIYNRWGELLFTSRDRYSSWDGRFNGVEQPVDSYIYSVHAVLYNNREKTYKGTFAIIK